MMHVLILTFLPRILKNKSKGAKQMNEEQEYKRIKGLFAGVEENQLALVDGAIREAARLRVELDNLHQIIKKTGIVKIHPDNPTRQKELPVSKLIVKTRANYLHYIAKLSNILGRNVIEDDDDLADFV